MGHSTKSNDPLPAVAITRADDGSEDRIIVSGVIGGKAEASATHQGATEPEENVKCFKCGSSLIGAEISGSCSQCAMPVAKSLEDRLVCEVDGSGCLTENCTCLGCGYNLRGIEPDRACPDCGRPIMTSLTRPLMRRRWLNIMGWSALLAGLATVLGMLHLIINTHGSAAFSVTLTPRVLPDARLNDLASLFAWGLILVAGARLTSLSWPSGVTGGYEERSGRRHLVPVLLMAGLVLLFVAGIAITLVGRLQPTIGLALQVLEEVLRTIVTILLIVQIARISLRMSAPGLAAQLSTSAWCYGGLGAFLVCWRATWLLLGLTAPAQLSAWSAHAANVPMLILSVTLIPLALTVWITVMFLAVFTVARHTIRNEARQPAMMVINTDPVGYASGGAPASI